jgi:hypothetical protein
LLRLRGRRKRNKWMRLASTFWLSWQAYRKFAPLLRQVFWMRFRGRAPNSETEANTPGAAI